MLKLSITKMCLKYMFTITPTFPRKLTHTASCIFVNIGSDNACHLLNADLLLLESKETDFSEILTSIFSIKKMRLKMWSEKCQPEIPQPSAEIIFKLFIQNFIQIAQGPVS